MNLLAITLRRLYNVYAILLFVLLMLIIFPFVIIVSLAGPVWGGNAIYRICMLWGDVWFPLVGIFHKNIYESPHDKKRSYIFVSNHISFLDAAVIVKTYRQPIRALGKKETSGIPVFGYIYKNAIVTVDRDNAADRSRSVRKLKAVLRRGISILIFPEGTFNETGNALKPFFDGAFRIAIETQTPVKPVLFLDVFNRMPYGKLLSLTPGKSRAVFMKEIDVTGLTIRDMDTLKQKVYAQMEERLLYYGVSWVK
ncbi:lysophospholipid acyltransferase family protein [Agriterribacter sp.]|uniref:lysophospholipid acyltransferase family protein n=1 Tax=Agriterribacter sp. TaxID=2821509 RepID=UPI002BD5A2D9|nr:lysophospholipid acyltransferase family protein [Agriterribacter sp.]HRO45228.1 lysophospholipid acyltransferase family protein [Agriterribacter sp.]HRQ16831.1 lysophospholipid acyltransferase family protein [Agriterribacter sp.]